MSVVSPHQKSISGIEDSRQNFLNIVRDEDESFEVGLKAAATSWTEPLRLMSSVWGRSRQYRLLSQAVLNRMAFTGKKRWRIITGLAAEHFHDETYRQDVANVWRGIDRMHATPFGVIEVVGVTVAPETVGGFTSLYAADAFRKQILSNEGVVVDFGTMTTNFLPFKLGVPQSDGFRSIDVGVFKVMEAATKSVRRRALPGTRSVDLESAYLNIHPLYMPTKSATGSIESELVDVGPDVDEAARKVWPQIEAALRSNLGSARGKLLFAIGGGVKVFGGLFQNSFSDSICMFSSPSEIQMENVRGLYLIAKSRAQSQG